jgi:hypothetical protein
MNAGASRKKFVLVCSSCAMAKRSAGKPAPDTAELGHAMPPMKSYQYPKVEEAMIQLTGMGCASTVDP